MKASSIGRRAKIGKVASTNWRTTPTRFGRLANQDQPSNHSLLSTISQTAFKYPEGIPSYLSHSISSHPLPIQTRGLATQSNNPLDFSSEKLQQFQDVDVVIVGAGVVGLALACSMVESATLSSRHPSNPFRLVIVDSASLSRTREWGKQKKAQASESTSQNKEKDWENRVISLSEENLQWLQEIGVYEHLIPSRLRPVHSMKVWDGLSGAEINFDSEINSSLFPSSAKSSASSEPLSTMVEISNLQQAMLSFLDSKKTQSSSSFQVEILEEKLVREIQPGSSGQNGKADRDPWPILHLSSSNNAAESSVSASSSVPFRARLLIGADGKNSPVRSYARIGTYGWSYDRKGLVGTMRCEESNPFLLGEQEGHTAWQRFLPTGPIAWLPLSPTTGSLVWTLPPRYAQALTILHRETSSSQPTRSEGGERQEAQPLAQLINAAYRLPWSEVEALLEQISQLAESGSSASTSISTDWSFLSREVSSAYFRNGLASPTGSVDGSSNFQAGWEDAESSSSHDQYPPAVLSLDSRSVASFPLQLSHADSYLGSSLNAHVESRLPIAPSRILDFGLSMAGLKPPTSTPEGSLEESSSPLPGRGRTVLVGDAAHTIHPLAGQGLNLGLADARSLCKTLEEATKNGADLGAHHSLTPYARDRYLKNQAIISGTDHLHWIYKYGAPKNRMEGEKVGIKEGLEERLGNLWVWARSTGVEVLNELEPIKKAMMQSAGSGKRRM